MDGGIGGGGGGGGDCPRRAEAKEFLATLGDFHDFHDPEYDRCYYTARGATAGR